MFSAFRDYLESIHKKFVINKINHITTTPQGDTTLHFTTQEYDQFITYKGLTLTEKADQLHGSEGELLFKLITSLSYLDEMYFNIVRSFSKTVAVASGSYDEIRTLDIHALSRRINENIKSLSDAYTQLTAELQIKTISDVSQILEKDIITVNGRVLDIVKDAGIIVIKFENHLIGKFPLQTLSSDDNKPWIFGDPNAPLVIDQDHLHAVLMRKQDNHEYLLFSDRNGIGNFSIPVLSIDRFDAHSKDLLHDLEIANELQIHKETQDITSDITYAGILLESNLSVLFTEGDAIFQSLSESINNLNIEDTEKSHAIDLLYSALFGVSQSPTPLM